MWGHSPSWAGEGSRPVSRADSGSDETRRDQRDWRSHAVRIGAGSDNERAMPYPTHDPHLWFADTPRGSSGVAW